MIEAYTDKNGPPLPAHVTFERAKGVAESIIRGDPDAAKVVGNSARAVAREFFARFGTSSKS